MRKTQDVIQCASGCGEEQLERLLGSDPCGAYCQMSEGTKRDYRSAVRELTTVAGLSEEELLKKVLRLTNASREDAGLGKHAAQSHVGYYLLGPGRQALQSEPDCGHVEATRAGTSTLLTFVAQYGGGMLLAALPIIFLPISTLWTLPCYAALSLLAIGAVFGPILQLSAITASPRSVPMMDTALAGTMLDSVAVAVSCVLIGERQVEALFAHLERMVEQTAPLPSIWILLADEIDSRVGPSTDRDEVLLALCNERIASLNERLVWRGSEVRISMFLRARSYDERQELWTGWERKRGKIEQLMGVIAGRIVSPFRAIGPVPEFSKVRYVLLLDDDTQVTSNGICRLLAAMQHPLNRPIIDSDVRRVKAGVGIAQTMPRVSAISAARWRYPAAMLGAVGHSDDERASVSILQTLFGQDLFCGKGLIDVSAYMQVIYGRLPTDRILSHDHIEGAYLRVATVNGCTFLEDAPDSLAKMAAQLHRWTRGDWQNLPWLSRRVRTRSGQIEAGPLDLFYRWRVLENVRASLRDVAFVALVAGAAFGPAGDCAVWIVSAFVVLLLPVYFTALLYTCRAISKRSLPDSAEWKTILRLHLVTGIFVCLAGFRATVSSDAIGKAVLRTATGKKLLEWRSTSEVGHQSVSGSVLFSGLLTAVGATALFIGVLTVRPVQTVWPVAVLCCIWAGSRGIARWLQLSAPEPAKT